MFASRLAPVCETLCLINKYDMIKTAKYIFPPFTYFKIVIKQNLKKSWWLYALCFLFAMKQLFSDDRSEFSIFMIVFGIVYLPVVLIYYYFWATNKKNEPLFVERQLIFDNGKIVITAQNGITSELLVNHIQKTIENTEYFLLYISKSQFIYLPKKAITNDSELVELKRILKKEA